MIIQFSFFNVLTQTGGNGSVAEHPPSRHQPCGIDQTDKYPIVAPTVVAVETAAVTFADQLTIEEVGEEQVVLSTPQPPQVMMDPEVLAAAGVDELLGRLTEDGNLVSARPRHRGQMKLKRTLSGGEISQQMDELVKSRKRTTAGGYVYLVRP